MSRLVFVITSPRMPADLLSRQAWQLLADLPVFAAAGVPVVSAVRAAGIDVVELDPDSPLTAQTLVTAGRDLVWLAGPGGDQDLARRVTEQLTGPDAPDVEVELLPGSWDPPGARLLDAVAVMDRLRSPGGCPWDAEQTHETLAPYLIEEAYETLDAIETGDDAELRIELGDMLLQVLFHARLAQEQDPGWSIDDVAGGLVDKLVRRHPHVFDESGAALHDHPSGTLRGVTNAADVNHNWEQIKAAERGGKSAYAGVPLGQPALRLAAALQRKAARDGGDAAGSPPQEEYADVAAVLDENAAARLLWALVARCRELDVDPEAALRSMSRRVRDGLMAAEIPPAAGQPGGTDLRR